MKKQPEITATTRKAFVDAFCALYQVKPIEKITIQELTNQAGYNRSTFYQYFTDVYDLLTYLEDLLIAHIREHIVANIAHGDLAQTFILSFTNMLGEKDTYIDVVLGNPNSRRFANRLKAEMIPVFIEALHLPKKEVKVTYILEFYLAAVISTVSHWFQSRRDLPIEELGALIRDVLKDGIWSQLQKYAQKPLATLWEG